MMYNKKQAKALGINKTLDLKEIILNTDGFYKIKNPKRTDLFLIGLYFFAGIGVIHTIMFYISLIK